MARKYIVDVIVGPNTPVTTKSHDIFGYPSKPTNNYRRIELFRPLELSADDDEQLRQLSENVDLELIDRFLIDKINQFVRLRADQMYANLTQLLVPPQTLIDIVNALDDDERVDIERYRVAKNYTQLSTILESKLNETMSSVDRRQTIDFIHRVLLPSFGCNNNDNGNSQKRKQQQKWTN